MFIDHLRIFAKAGDGGGGCVSFRREKYVPKGGPDGGDGGRGGDIVLRVDPNVDNLTAFHYQPIIRGQKGSNGQGKKMFGRAAKPTVVAVPPGTIVSRLRETAWPAAPGPAIAGGGFFDLEAEPAAAAGRRSAPSPDQLELLADLAVDGQEFVLCRGGDGGKGNVHFKSSRNRVPRESTPGEPGEEGYFYLELRKIADAGLAGYPNAGKSTLLAALSAARPKVAPYPFTTLHPVVGVVEYPDYSRVTVADIPGLIEGAHRNVGLGHDFLRHIVRCKLLLHVVDMAGSEGRDPADDLARLREELKLYDPALAQRPWLIVANKMDLPGAAEQLKAFRRRHRRTTIIPVSAREQTGLDALRAELHLAVAAAGGR